MRSILILFSISVIFTVVSSFINPYPRFKFYKDDSDPGEPLYLTPYIENGDIETVWYSILIYVLRYFPFLKVNFSI